MMKGSNSSEREARKIKVQLTHIIQQGEQLKRRADAALEKEKRAKKKAERLLEYSQNSGAWLADMKDAPIFYPTSEEFQDPMRYIQSVQAEASKFAALEASLSVGICKIVPPCLPAMLPASSVKAPDGSRLKFTTRQQTMQKQTWKNFEATQFYQGPRPYTLAEFEKNADLFQAKQLGSAANLPPKMVEAAYWWQFDHGEALTVEYGNDVEGTAFAAPDSADPLGKTKWNLQVLPTVDASCLRLMGIDIPGVTSPMLYVGMLFSTFAWHVEDHNLYSINYQHMGAAKTWYGVPASGADGFDDVVVNDIYGKAMQNEMAKGVSKQEAVNKAHNTLIAKTTVFSPKALMDKGVPVYRVVQSPGEYVITFPRSYHGGFSNGFCVGEAVNFGMGDWFQYGLDACLRYSRLQKSPMLSQEQLLIIEAQNLTRDDPSLKQAAKSVNASVLPQFVAFIKTQQRLLKKMKDIGADAKVAKDPAFRGEPCQVCEHICYLLQVKARGKLQTCARCAIQTGKSLKGSTVLCHSSYPELLKLVALIENSDFQGPSEALTLDMCGLTESQHWSDANLAEGLGRASPTGTSAATAVPIKKSKSLPKSQRVAAMLEPRSGKQPRDQTPPALDDPEVAERPSKRPAIVKLKLAVTDTEQPPKQNESSHPSPSQPMDCHVEIAKQDVETLPAPTPCQSPLKPAQDNAAHLEGPGEESDRQKDAREIALGHESAEKDQVSAERLAGGARCASEQSKGRSEHRQQDADCKAQPHGPGVSTSDLTSVRVCSGAAERPFSALHQSPAEAKAWPQTEGAKPLLSVELDRSHGDPMLLASQIRDTALHSITDPSPGPAFQTGASWHPGEVHNHGPQFHQAKDLGSFSCLQPGSASLPFASRSHADFFKWKQQMAEGNLRARESWGPGCMPLSEGWMQSAYALAQHPALHFHPSSGPVAPSRHQSPLLTSPGRSVRSHSGSLDRPPLSAGLPQRPVHLAEESPGDMPEHVQNWLRQSAQHAPLQQPSSSAPGLLRSSSPARCRSPFKQDRPSSSSGIAEIRFCRLDDPAVLPPELSFSAAGLQDLEGMAASKAAAVPIAIDRAAVPSQTAIDQQACSQEKPAASQQRMLMDAAAANSSPQPQQEPVPKHAQPSTQQGLAQGSLPPPHQEHAVSAISPDVQSAPASNDTPALPVVTADVLKNPSSGLWEDPANTSMREAAGPDPPQPPVAKESVVPLEGRLDKAQPPASIDKLQQSDDRPSCQEEARLKPETRREPISLTASATIAEAKPCSTPKRNPAKTKELKKCGVASPPPAWFADLDLSGTEFARAASTRSGRNKQLELLQRHGLGRTSSEAKTISRKRKAERMFADTRSRKTKV